MGLGESLLRILGKSKGSVSCLVEIPSVAVCDPKLLVSELSQARSPALLVPGRIMGVRNAQGCELASFAKIRPICLQIC